jgi:hypothetical protein
MSQEGERLRKRFNDLAWQAQSFFEEIGCRTTERTANC